MGRSLESRPEFEKREVGGKVEVISGCMFSGKSDELIRRLRRAPFAKKKYQVFKPEVDTRRGEDSINSADGASLKAISVKDSKEILEKVRKDTNWIGIDEAQFFDDDLPEVCDLLAKMGKRIMVAGLDTDFRGESFGPMDRLIREAEEVQKMVACCEVCGQDATRTQRIVNGEPANYEDPVVIVGAEELYEARCRVHHELPGKKNNLIFESK